MDTFFEIVEVVPIGDPDSGEAHVVTLHHHCSEGEPVSLNAYFGKFRAGVTTAICPECNRTTTVVKQNGGDIFIRQEV